MSKVSWVFGLLQANGIDTSGMSLDQAFAELEKLRKSGKVSDDAIKFSKSHSNEQSKTGNTRKTNASEADTTSVKQQMQASQDKLKGKKPVAEIKGDKIITDYKTAATALRKALSENDGVVSRKGFGDVQVGARLKQAGAYIKKPSEIAALAAVPAVIRNGVEIAHHGNHKGRGYSTYTFAANVQIGDKVGIVAVVVKRTKGDFYEVHRVLMPDGKAGNKKDTD
ncbi:MAG: hypothetical protein K2L51_02740 [Clostridiales bacterium]|nr:hypothetical protein [Clostridiales bacterium]